MTNHKIIRCDDSGRSLRVRSQNTGDTESLVVQDQVNKIEMRGYQRGFLEGERAGKKSGEEMVEAAAKRYDRRVAEMISAYGSLVSSFEKTLTTLAVETSKKIIRRDLTMNPEALDALVVDTLSRVKFQPQITLRVSRTDFARLREILSTLNPAVAVKEDPSLEIGDFIIDTAQTHLDGRVDSQVDTLGRAMLDE